MSDRPNVLLISIDSFRRDFCSAFNSVERTTPTMLNLSSDFTAFENVVTPSTWTLPVHTSLFTGLYPEEHGIYNQDEILGNRLTLAELLADADYITKSFGHNGWIRQGATLRGFEHTTTLPQSGLVDKLIYNCKELISRTPSKDRHTVDTARTFLREAPEPFCAFVHLQGAHFKHQPHISDFKQFSDGGHRRMRRLMTTEERMWDDLVHRFIQHDLTSDEIAGIKNLYRAELRRIDRLVSTLVETVTTATDDSSQETFVAIFADHGDAYGENTLFGHTYSVAESIVRIPLLVRDPTDSLVVASDSIVQLSDLYPTIARICGCSPPDTRMYDLTETEREAAFVHHRPPQSNYEQLQSLFEQRGIDQDRLPAKEIYAVWKGPGKHFEWRPEKGDEEQIADKQLFDVLQTHFDSLQPAERHSSDTTSDAIIENLKDMGYM